MATSGRRAEIGHRAAARLRWTGVLVLGLLLGWLPGAAARELHLGGLTFSDELGGFRLLAGRGSGTLADPFVLEEEITDDGPAILAIRGMRHRFGNRISSQHAVGFALTKIVRNRTSQAWSLFTLELREFADLQSPFGDGLSFGQASSAGRPFRSDRFAEAAEVREPYDEVQFSGGLLAPGERAAFHLVVTDTTPRSQFFLLQKRDSPLALEAWPDALWVPAAARR